MSPVRILTIAALALSALALSAGPAGAAVPTAKNAKFCKAADKIGTSSSNPTRSEAKTTASRFKQAAKYAPSKVKSAMNKIATTINRVASSSSPQINSKVEKEYRKAINTYSAYYHSQCSG
jgi:hypothetical protein